MMPGPRIHITASPTPTVLDQPLMGVRVALKPIAPITGYVDGAWWPRSRDLTTELPALLVALTARLGCGARVAFNLTAWAHAPRRIKIDGRVVRLEGFRTLDEHIVDVSAPNGQRARLLVVPPETPPTTAQRALVTASQPGNSDSVLIKPSSAPHGGHDGAEARWEADGGRVYERG